MKRIALIGLGLVGTALAQRLHAAGFTVSGYDCDVDARARFIAAGFSATENLDSCAQDADALLLAVYDTAGVLEVIAILERQAVLPPLILDCSTGDPDKLAALGTRLKTQGIDFLEAPLSGSSVQIAAGEALMLLGGDAAVVSREDALLVALSSRYVHVGSYGYGARAKLATNLVLGLNRAALAEGMVFAETLGITRADFLQLILSSPANSAAAHVKGAMMVEERFAPQSRIRQHLKDVDLMCQQAAALGQRLPLSETHAALMRKAVDAGDGELDNAAIIRQIKRSTT
jgi:3-hydroxyisobutyrate dehydrogenase-like beta-hydroxyacid dehydrogenase